MGRKRPHQKETCAIQQSRDMERVGLTMEGVIIEAQDPRIKASLLAASYHDSASLLVVIPVATQGTLLDPD